MVGRQGSEPLASRGPFQEHCGLSKNSSRVLSSQSRCWPEQPGHQAGGESFIQQGSAGHPHP